MAKIHFPGKSKWTFTDGTGELVFEAIDAVFEYEPLHWYEIFILGMGRG